MENRQETALQALERITNIVHKVVMDKLSYYTTSIEDIRVGYECEYRSITHAQWSFVRVEPNWIDKDEEATIYDYFDIGNIRTPYLTKEQIEAEGLKPLKDVSGALLKDLQSSNSINFPNFYKTGGYCITLVPDNHSIRITFFAGVYPVQVLFCGRCPSINEFRTICKLLNI